MSGDGKSVPKGNGLGVLELFTLPTFRAGVDWQSVVAAQQCAYLGGKCFKTRKSDPSISIGTCTVSHNIKDPKRVIICPARFLERSQVFLDCIHLLTLHEPGNELHRVPEVSIPGGNVDFCLASVRRGKIVDFVGIELQAVDTTGTVWPSRQKFLASVGLPVDGSSGEGYGMNWKMSAKTILVQLHHKVQTFEHVNRRFVLVVQDHFLTEMQASFNFGHIVGAKLGDPMHIHAYTLNKEPDEYRLELATRISTDSDGIAVSLGLQASPKVELAEIIANLEKRMAQLNKDGRSTLLRV
jgi:hypothetical protein